MSKKQGQSRKAGTISERLGAKVAASIKAGAGEPPPSAQAHCSSQDCGGDYKCGGPGSHSCTKTFNCSGQKYSGTSGEDCPGTFNCHHAYATS